jgi:tyrosine-protein phosphatase YwqE
MGDFYKNTPEGIREKLALLKKVASDAGMDMDLHCAAEYYLDEWFIAKLENKVEMLTFGAPRYLLFETSFINKPINFDEAVFMMKMAGYVPVLAHPERYTYLYNSPGKLAEMRESGMFLQININSLGGYYSPAAQKVAERMIEDKIVDFAGTDTHNPKHISALERARASKYYSKLLQLPLLNHTI